MPTVTGNGLPFDMTNLFNNSNFLQSTGVSGSSTAFVTSFLSERWEFTGTGFSDFFGTIPRAGTINTFKFFWGSTLNFTATNLSLPIPVLFSYMNSNDLVGLHNWIFAGNDTINGGSAAENLLGYGGNDVISGGDGDDSINPGPGVDQVDGGAGLDLLTLNRSDSSLSFTFDTALLGSNAGQTLADGSIIRNMERFDLTTGSGNDSFFVMSIPDTNGAWPMRVDGGAGYDTLSADFSSVGNAPSYVQWTNIESWHITFGFEADYITGGSGDDVINGGGGNDTIIASGGVDILDGGDGVDVLGFVYHSLTTDFHANFDGFYTASGATMPNGTIIRNIEDVGLYTGSGNDSLTISGQFLGTVRFGGGGGLDTLIGNFSAVTAFDVDFETAQGFIDIDTGRVWFNEVDRFVITGGAMADELLVTGTFYNADDILDGGGGDDIISGGLGSDLLIGGNGNDRLYAVEQFASEANPVSGNDVLIGGAGADQLWGTASFATASYETSSGAVSINLLVSVASGGHAQGDQLFSIEGLIGSAFNDTLIGNTANNVFDAGAGNDRLEGGSGNDTLNGGGGNDLIFVGTGTDLANGGDDNDDFSIQNTELSAGDAFNGGNGFDSLLLSNANASPTFDFTVTTVTSIERIDLSALTGGGISSTQILSTQIGAQFAPDLTLVGSANVANFFTIVMPDAGTVNLSTWTLSNWVAGNSIFVTGSAAADTITGTTSADAIAGNNGNDILIGGDGNDSLNGGSGADAMYGGNGNDSYNVDDAGDQTLEASALGGAEDAVNSTVTWTLTANIEYLFLQGSGAINGSGNVLNNWIVGNSAANTLFGFDGNDILDGGAGADQMFGGLGDDTYYVDNAGDVTSEASALGGTDIVYSSVNRQLTANIENLTLTGSAQIGYGNIINNTIVGNAAANTLYGFEGNDRLDGGVGADTMFGASGDDTYVVDNANDVTVEGIAGLAGGIDTIESSIDRGLNANIENLVLTGTAAIGYGNVLDNVMTGNASANSLFGFDGADVLNGGAGADQMFGGNGNDTYYVDNTGDVTSETSAAGGIDTVISSVARTLTANIENLTLTGSANITGSGNVLDNVIIGNAGANTLYGLDGADTLDGGLGADTLQGGAGADTYVFSTALGSGNVDAIFGFNVADDTIQLNNAVFTGLSAGALAAGAFVIGAVAADADDRIIYNSSTGQLYFDADGNDVGAAVLFATLAASLALTNNDFIIDPGI